MIISIIVAVAQNGVIGAKNQLPWRLSADLKRFKQITTGHHIIMGRKTFESIGKPLPNRVSIIITRNTGYQAEGCHVVGSLAEAVQFAQSNGETEAFVIGGGQIYEEAFTLAHKVYLTQVKANIDGDTFFPSLPSCDWETTQQSEYLADERNQYDYSFVDLERVG